MNADIPNPTRQASAAALPDPLDKLCTAIGILQAHYLAESTEAEPQAVFAKTYIRSDGACHAINLLVELLPVLEDWTVERPKEHSSCPASYPDDLYHYASRAKALTDLLQTHCLDEPRFNVDSAESNQLFTLLDCLSDYVNRLESGLDELNPKPKHAAT